MVQNLQNYTARALNDIDDSRINDGIMARNPLNSDDTIEIALKQVGTHLLYGSNKYIANNSCWISHSKDLCKVISNYSFSSNRQLHQRSNIAIIEKYNGSLYSNKASISTVEELKQATIANVPGLNLNLSNGKAIDILYKLGILINKDGIIYTSKGCMALNYAKCSSELLSLNTIDKDAIKYTLNALIADIVYACVYCNTGKSSDEIIDDVVSHKNDILNCIDNMSSLFQNFYKATYESKKEIYNLVEECDLNKNDPLAIELFIIETKREFLKTILDKVFNIKDVDINLLEDSHHLAVIGKPKVSDNINLFGQEINLPCFDYQSNCPRISQYEDSIVAMVGYEDACFLDSSCNVFTCHPKTKELYLMSSSHRAWKCINNLNK